MISRPIKMQSTAGRPAGLHKLQGARVVTTLGFQVEISVADVNDHAPRFPNPVWQLAFSEGSQPGTR